MRLPVPRALSSRLILLAAAALLIAQLLSLYLLSTLTHRQWQTLSVAPAVIRLLDVAEDGAPQPYARRRSDPVEILAEAPRASGEDSPQLAARAEEMLANAGLRHDKVHVWLDHRPHLGPRDVDRIVGRDLHAGRSRARLTLAVQLGPHRWLVARSRTRAAPPPLALALLGQTLLIFAAMLVPLLWIGRRLTAPLGVLTHAARSWRPPDHIEPLPEAGARDIRDLTRAFNEMRARIAALLGEKDHMLGAIGHDLRTPLASLRVRVECVEDEAERQAMVKTIEDMNQMLEDILALARAGRERQPPQRLDLASLADAVMEDFVAMGADVALSEDSARAVVSVHGAALRRAVRNLVDNAVKYGVRARLSVRIAGDRAMLSVEDDGPGIPPDRIAEMLEPFARLERSRSRETGGTGLGLALVKAVVEGEGGALTLANRSDGRTGLIARISLPLA